MCSRRVALSVRGRRDAPSAGQSGETLVELVFAVALMGIGMAAILASLLTTSATAKLNKDRTQVSVFLQSWGDYVISPRATANASNYGTDCPSLIDPAGNTFSKPAGWTTSATVEYLQGSAGTQPANWAALSWVSQDGCISQGDRGLIRITLKVKTASGKGQVTDSLVVFRRDDRCPANASFDNPDQGPC